MAFLMKEVHEVNPVLQAAVTAYINQATAKGLHLLEQKEINYGCQLRFGATSGIQGQVNLYYSKKKGISIVGMGKDTEIKRQLETLGTVASAAASPVAATIAYSQEDRSPRWMGCDESGKGDVFGPLVAAACIITTQEEQLFRQWGVQDSKSIGDTKISLLAEKIKTQLGTRYSLQVWMPCVYNEKYTAFVKKHKNLNDLLGSIHGENIKQLLSTDKCTCIIVDKFGKDEYVLQAVGPIADTHRIIQIPQGERDMAVAAASILARQAFLESMQQLSDTYGMVFPKGAFQGVHKAIENFLSTHDKNELTYVGKLHFKTFDFLR
ncbi:ribonuclease HII [Megasphaera hutchinsoni]|uniref:Ribonuclease n=1 Tax=Megasphaera hutchinsoni TaxID=1588748 RepID=A0A134CJD1_9FIRM|nr:ribonuclease HII [Megasphaera hutchinsoni]